MRQEYEGFSKFVAFEALYYGDTEYYVLHAFCNFQTANYLIPPPISCMEMHL